MILVLSQSGPFIEMKGPSRVRLTVNGRVAVSDEDSFEGNQAPEVVGTRQDLSVGRDVLPGETGAVLSLCVLLRPSILQVHGEAP